MTKLIEQAVKWSEEHQTRRGFMAKAGKVALGLGVAMAGVAHGPFTARAAQACCGAMPECLVGCYTPGIPSWPLPVANPCPPGGVHPGSMICCDAGGTGNCWECFQCYFPTPGRDCACSYNTGIRCGTPGGPC